MSFSSRIENHDNPLKIVTFLTLFKNLESIENDSKLKINLQNKNQKSNFK